MIAEIVNIAVFLVYRRMTIPAPDKMRTLSYFWTMCVFCGIAFCQAVRYNQFNN